MPLCVLYVMCPLCLSVFGCFSPYFFHLHCSTAPSLIHGFTSSCLINSCLFKIVPSSLVLILCVTQPGACTWLFNFMCVLCFSGERPFCCKLCPYRASQKGNLKTHVQSVHHMPFDNSQYLDTRSLLLSQEAHGAQAAKHPPTPQKQ